MACYWPHHARIQKALPEEVRHFFIRGKRIQIALKAGHHWPASETPLSGISLGYRWWPNILRRIQTSIAKKAHIFCDFQGGGGVSWPPDSPFWIRPCSSLVIILPVNVFTFLTTIRLIKKSCIPCIASDTFVRPSFYWTIFTFALFLKKKVWYIVRYLMVNVICW